VSDPTLIFLEADDEITTVVRRVREADPGRVVIVAPGRSRATSSAIALRLLARAAEADGREIAIVGDALTRSLAAEAGLASHGTVEDAKGGATSDEPAALSQTAAIHVVRGPRVDDTAPTLAGGAVSREADTVVRPAAPRHASPPPGRRRAPTPGRRQQPRRRLPAIVGIGILGAVVVAWAVIAAMVLPAATVAITPRSVPIDPVPDVIAIADPERLSDTVRETVTVTATGTYDLNEPAVGSVTFLNWNFFGVEVPEGAFVAAGEQAFATDEVVVVPAGSFDPFGGGITAGEASVNVTAAAPGPAGNVAAEAIDTVLDPNLASQLRGFPTITERLVTNPEPTSGGETSSGSEIKQEDVDAALADLRALLEAAVVEALGDGEGSIHVDVDPGAEPTIEGVEGLVGTRDPESAEISGTLAYDRLVVDPAVVEERAIERFGVNSSVLPPGWQLDPDATRVEIGAARLEGDAMVVAVQVSGARVPLIDRAAILETIIGQSAPDAEAALADLGEVSVDLWPAWVGTVPDSDWRIDLQVAEP